MYRDLNESFAVEDGAYLVRRVVPARGTPYEHRCPRAAFEAVAYAVAEAGEAGRSFTLTELAAETGLPASQAATALAFLKERGYVQDGPRRRNVANPGFGHDDAMCEYHALYEEPAAEAGPPPGP
jgi:hypothetical protein